MASTQHSLRPESRLGAVCCTRVGIYWPGIVRTVRAPDPHSVHPTLVQWRPTLVEWTNIVQTIKDTRPVAPHPRGVDTGRRAGSPSWCFGGEVGRVGRRRVRTLCLVFGGSVYEREGYPTNARPTLRTRGARLARLRGAECRPQAPECPHRHHPMRGGLRRQRRRPPTLPQETPRIALIGARVK